MCKEELPRRPKEIPITEPLPPFPRLGAVVNYRSKVRGKLDYNQVSQVRNIIEHERRKRQESRTQVRFKLHLRTQVRFKLHLRISSDFNVLKVHE